MSFRHRTRAEQNTRKYTAQNFSFYQKKRKVSLGNLLNIPRWGCKVKKIAKFHLKYLHVHARVTRTNLSPTTYSTRSQTFISQRKKLFFFSPQNFCFMIFFIRRIKANMTNFTFLLLILWLPFTITSSLSRCPKDCDCDLDPTGRYFTACMKGNMEQIPISEIDKRMEIIIIQNPKHKLTIGHLFTDFKKLEILRITDANVPAIGEHSFWGVPSLRTLDLSRNNISHVFADNFKGQQNLIELNLSRNKLERIPSGTFTFLLVSDIYCISIPRFIDIPT